ncbi:MAG: GatB/YqeY domain-containing protein [bacterium]|nr:GatB/YqeY domain-containing protein [bacterium]
MSLNEKLQADMKEAMIAKDEMRLSTIRFLLSDLNYLKIEKQRELTDEDVLGAIEKQVKRHRESIEGFEKGGRAEMAEKEKAELAILQTYLPAQMSEEDIRKAVGEAIASSGASSIQEMGKVMAALSSLKGKADMSVVSSIVKEKLS